MILSDGDIRGALERGIIEITPLADGAIRSASVDLRLGPVLKIDDPNEPGGWREHDLRTAPYRLYRGVFVLGATLEFIALDPTLCADLKGKSSRAREGLVLENAGFVDPGWRGELTTEMENRRLMPLTLALGMKIGQIRFYPMLTAPLVPYGSDGTSHYQGSRGPVPSRTGGQR